MTQSREGLAVVRPTAQAEEARPEVIARLADRVVGAMMLRDSKTLAEQRTRGAAARSMTPKADPECL